MSRAGITLAVNSYDRHAPMIEGAVGDSDLDIHVMEVGQSQPGRYGTSRHERFLPSLEFDACELSFSSYLVAVDQGLPVQAIPVFPRRLFSQSQMYKNVHSGIAGPADLRGKRVGLSSYQTTLSVLAKGDLEHVYGVPWKSITWVTSRTETLEVELPPDVRLEQSSPEQIDADLVSGQLQAYSGPHPGNRNSPALGADALRTSDLRYRTWA